MKKAIALALALAPPRCSPRRRVARPTATAGTAAFSCTAPTIGIAAPLTGGRGHRPGAARLQYAIANFKRYGISVTLKQGDTQLAASLSRTVAQKFVSDTSLLGVVGGSTSQSVISSGSSTGATRSRRSRAPRHGPT